MERALLLILLQAVLVRADYTIEIKNPQVTTPTNQLANGGCCLSSQTPPQCTRCARLVLTLCFREDRHDTDDMNINNCLGYAGPKVIALSYLTTYRATMSTFTRYTGAYQLLFQVTSNENSEALVDSALVRVEQPLNGQSRQLQVTGSRGLATLSLQVTVTCSSTFSSCPTDISCVPRDDLFGHYTCGAGGEVVCLSGYQDPASYCTEESQLTTQGGGSGPMTTPTVASEPMTTPTAASKPMTTPTAVNEPMATPTAANEPMTTPTQIIDPSLTTTNNNTRTEESLEFVVGVAIGAAVGFTAALILVIIGGTIVGLVWRCCKSQSGVKEEIEMEDNPVYNQPLTAGPRAQLSENRECGLSYASQSQRLNDDYQYIT